MRRLLSVIASLVLVSWCAQAGEVKVSGHYLKRLELPNGVPMRRFVPAGDRKGGWAWNETELVHVDENGKATSIGAPSRAMVERGSGIYASDSGADAVRFTDNHDLVRASGRLVAAAADRPEFIAFPGDDHLWLALHTKPCVVHIDAAGRAVEFPLDYQSVRDGRASGGTLWCVIANGNGSRLLRLDAARPNVVTTVADFEGKDPLSTSDDDAICWLPQKGGVTIVGIASGVRVTNVALDAAVSDIKPAGNSDAFVKTDNGWRLVNATGGTVTPSPSIGPIDEVVAGEVVAGKTLWIVSDGKLFSVSKEGKTSAALVEGVFDLTAMPSDGAVNPFTLSAVNTPVRISGDVKNLMALHVTDKGEALVVTKTGVALVSAKGVVKRVHAVQHPYAVMAAPDRRHFWIADDGPALFVVGSDGHSSDIDLSPLPTIAFGEIFPSADGKHLFTGGGLTVVRPYWIALFENRHDVTAASIDFAQATPLVRRLLLSDKTPRVAVDPAQQPWQITVDWPGLEQRYAARGVVEAVIGKQNGAAILPPSDEKVAARDGPISEKAQPQWKKGDRWSATYPVTLRYEDAQGSRVEIEWADVKFDVPFLERPYVRGALCAGTIVLLFLGLPIVLLALGKKSRWIQWTPLLTVVFGSTTFIPNVTNFLSVDPRAVALFVVAFDLSIIPAALIDPRIFPSLAGLQPFKLVASGMVSIGWMRRRIYAEYLEDLQARLSALRKDASREIYCEIPASTSSSPDVRMEGLTAAPAADMASSICRADPAERCHLLITAPGGRGKSALLRRLVEIAVERFRSDPRLPIPILCDAGETTVQAAAAAGLGGRFITDAFEMQLQGGHFLLFIDGLSEKGLTAEAIGKHLTGKAGKSGYLVIASRPSAELEAQLETKSRRWLLIEPQRLDAATLPLFEKSYLTHDPGAVPLTPGRMRACVGRDGTYLPLLVRLALQVHRDDVDDFKSLYEATFLRLMRADTSSPLEEASDLCLKTYWQNGYRALPYERFKDEIDPLVAAGILVKVPGTINPITGQPREVRFFHDTMQSYLTARALATSAGEEWTCLERAAGAAVFVEAESDLVTGGSELFQFCVEVFAPRDRLRDVLAAHLRRWADQCEGDLKKNEIVSRTADVVRVLVPKEASAGAALSAIVDAAERAEEEEALKTLAAVYARIAPLVWPARKRDAEAALGLAA